MRKHPKEMIKTGNCEVYHCINPIVCIFSVKITYTFRLGFYYNISACDYLYSLAQINYPSLVTLLLLMIKNTLNLQTNRIFSAD